MNLTVNKLIRDYLNAAEYSIQVMRRHFGVEHLLQSVGQRSIPASGRIEGEGVLEFRFHGFGCAVTTDAYEVDFDFDADSNCTSFDSWRLMLFAQSQPGKYGELENRDRIEHELLILQKKGIVMKQDNDLHTNFYQMV